MCVYMWMHMYMMHMYVYMVYMYTYMTEWLPRASGTTLPPCPGVCALSGYPGISNSRASRAELSLQAEPMTPPLLS